MKKWKSEKVEWCAAVLFGLFLLAGCSHKAAETASGVGSESVARTFKDDLGREVRVPARIERAVSLAPSLTELVFAAGAGDRLAGVTTYCDFPEAAKVVEKIGDTQNPNIERIVALRPQIVFVSTASQLKSFTRTLDEQGIGVFVIDVKGIGDVARSVRRLGELFGTGEQAEQKIADVERRLNAIESKKIGVPIRTFVQISNEPLFTIGRESFLTAIVERAGGVSVTKDVATAYPKISKETALALNPDVIVLSDSEDNREPNVVFQYSPAVRNGRVFKVNADIVSRPGPRLVDALEQIAGFLAQVD